MQLPGPKMTVETVPCVAFDLCSGLLAADGRCDKESSGFRVGGKSDPSYHGYGGGILDKAMQSEEKNECPSVCKDYVGLASPSC